MADDILCTPDGNSAVRASSAIITVSALSAHLSISHAAGNAGATDDGPVLSPLASPPLYLRTADDSAVAFVYENSAPPGNSPPVYMTTRVPALP